MKKRSTISGVLLSAFAASTAAASSTFDETPARADFIQMEIMSQLCELTPEEQAAAGVRIREAVAQIGQRNGKVAFQMIDRAVWELQDKPAEREIFCEDALESLRP